MGRTVRMSQRTSKSQYARKRKATSSSSQQHEAPQNYQHQSSVSPDVSTQADQHSPTQFIQPITDNRPDNTCRDCIPVSMQLSAGPISSQEHIHSIYDDLGVHVSQQAKQKIINGEYIVLGILLDKTSVDFNKQLALDDQGQLVLKQKTVKQLTDLHSWLYAFLIYASIYTSAHPQSTQGILKYMYNIKLGASRTSTLGWRDYDQQYRLRKARSPTSSWGTIDQELWLLYMNPVAAQPFTAGKQPSLMNKSTVCKCYEFNNSGRCTRPYCNYKHSCLRCEGSHPAMRCRVSNSRFGQSSFNHKNFRDFSGKPQRFVNRKRVASGQPSRK